MMYRSLSLRRALTRPLALWLLVVSLQPIFTGSVGAQPSVDATAEVPSEKKPRTFEIVHPIPFDSEAADRILSDLQIFPANNPWNTAVDTWPVADNSKSIIEAIGSEKPLRANHDMAFILTPPGQPLIDVRIVGYPEESDAGPYPLPANVPIEGWPASFRLSRDSNLNRLTLDDVQRGRPSLEADRHGIVIDPNRRKLYEFYKLTKTDSGWTAAQASVFDLSSNRLRPDGWTSADAAGLPIFPAVARFDEFQRGQINHALRVTFKVTRRAYVYPATHFASKRREEDLPRMGERFRLRRDFDTSGFSPNAKVLLEALKRFGMLTADNGIDWAVSVAPDERIPFMHEELRRVKGTDFEVVVAPEGYVQAK